MDTTDLTQDSPLTVLGQSVATLTACYRQLLESQAAPAHCQEAGRTLRFVAHRYSLLLSALYGPNGTNGSEEEAEEENGANILTPLRLIPGGEPEGDPGED